MSTLEEANREANFYIALFLAGSLSVITIIALLALILWRVW